MMKHIRFGKIPKDGKSVNYFKLSFEQQDNLEYEEYPEEAKEIWLSVFNMENNLPILENLQLVSTLHDRVKHGYTAYIVTGNKVADGNDGEPLLSNVKILEEYQYTKDEMFKYIISVLIEKYQNHSGEYIDAESRIFFGTFYTEEKRNIKTGTIVSVWENYGSDGYETLKPYTKVTCNGMDFWNPIDGWDTKLGCN